MKNHNLLTYLKIIVCCSVFFVLPVCADLLVPFANSRTVALTLVISTAAMFLIFANHQLAALHWRRFMDNPKENLIYIFFAALFVLGVGLLSRYFFHFEMEIIDAEILSKYPFFAPVILISYTFSHAFSINIIFKLMTDKFHFSENPLIVILCSGLMFAIYLTCSQFILPPLLSGGFSPDVILKGFMINLLVSLCISYCYNQTRSVFPMTFGLTLASLILLF